MKWLLDTNVLIHALRGRPESVQAHLAEASPDEVAVSAVTVAELWYGAAKSHERLKKQDLWRRVLEPFAILPFDLAAAELHGDLRYALRQSPIGERDLLIACIALANDLTLVTANVAELSRVPGLRVEDWSAGTR